MTKAPRLRSLLARVLFGFAAALTAAAAAPAASGPEDGALPQRWIESPFRRFGAAQVLIPGRAVLFDEAEDPATRSALVSELHRISSELYGRDGWRLPFAETEPLRIYIARREAEGVRQIAARSVERGRLVAPALLLDGTALTTAQIVREVTRQIVSATVSGYGVAQDAFLTQALVAALSNGAGEAGDEEEAWILAAAPMLDFRAHPSTLGRLWVDEIVRQTGDTSFLRLVWERASESGEAPMPLLLRMFEEVSAVPEKAVLARAAARLYAALEPEASPSRLRILDLEAGALDAAAPAELTVSHRSFLPEGAEDALRVSWPEDGGSGAAVVRYRDLALPSDVVLFAAGDTRTIPLSGVARVDWVVAGSVNGGLGIRAPAFCVVAKPNLYTGLEAHASAGAERPRLFWRTASHDGLWGWAVFREEVRPDGRIARTGPEIVPSSERADEPFGYAFVDTVATAGTFYRYTVWAVTDEGLLARAFAVTLRAGE